VPDSVLKRYFDTARPHLLAHRGLSQHQLDIDENSIAAFEQALKFGATHIESDVHATKDGIAVLFHDDDLERVAGLPLKISELTFAELSEIKLAHGSKVPSLKEVLEHFPSLRLNLDVKAEAGCVATAAVINEFKAFDRVLVSSFSRSRKMQTLRLLDGPVATSASSTEVLGLWITHKFFGLGFGLIAKNFDAIQIPRSFGPIHLDTKGFIERARKHGLEVHFWTVNDPAEGKLLLAAGATGIVSDRVDLFSF
jgi:glycerophosphoryl diester phosphodiesterase